MRLQLGSVRRLGMLVCAVGFVWSLLFVSMMLNETSEEQSENLKDEILALSQKYVRSLAKDSQNAVDGPYTGRLTGYDLKKTMAVLLEDMMERLERIEARLDAAAAGSNVSALAVRPHSVRRSSHHEQRVVLSKEEKVVEEKPVNAKESDDLLLGVQEDCSVTSDELLQFPSCPAKIAWMRSHWKSDSCYAYYGVDGSECSFRIYLSEIETWCPVLTGRKQRLFNTSNSEAGTRQASLKLDLHGLLNLLRDPGQRHNYEWMKMRIERMWPNWLRAAKSLSTQNDFQHRPQKRILVHLGLLSSKSGFKIPETSFKGGPLGELVQWSDLISALYVLGHDLIITSEVEQLQQILVKFPSAEAQCQSRTTLPLDLLYTDIVGLTQFKRKVKQGYGKFSCLLRIIDSFGTEPAYNYDIFAKAHRLKTQWGMQNLNPQQFFTMFPHSPDNSFMGFVVENHLNETVSNTVPRKNQAVVYGKAEYMWQGKDSYLSIIHKHAEIHATVFLEKTAQSSIIPSFIKNHGIMSGPDLHALLRESKLFIGLGFPYEGPAPLEAIALGNIFINPKFDPPHNSENTKFFRGKPTSRKVTSQHPYAEDFIASPNVITVDIDDKVALEEAVVKALKEEAPKPYMPYEFTEEGMLQRVNAYILHQDFCRQDAEKPWPPASSIQVITAAPGVSCKDACRQKDLICEPSHFPRLNTAEMLKQYNSQPCTTVSQQDDIYYPAMETTGACFLQKEHLLFSCMGAIVDLKRLCPCRDYIKGQTALCMNCVS